MLKRRLFYVIVIVLLLVAIGLLMSGAWRSRPNPSLATVDLGDGRILQIEGVTFGTNNQIGSERSELLKRVRPWLPGTLAYWLEPKYPLSAINGLSRPALVVWVNAIDADTKTNVDCQSIRTVIVGEQGDLFGADTSSWWGFDRFWRVGHVFYAYPRTEPTLTMEVTTWKGHHTNYVKFPNPHMAQSAEWHGEPLPQTNRVGDLDVVLAGLNLRTNGGPKPSYWQTKSLYWEPVWELRRAGEIAAGWDAPEWLAEDPTGNCSQQLGTHQPVLRFSAEFFPSATNLETASLIATMPEVVVTNPQPTNWWNQKIQSGQHEFLAIGFFPRGNYVFSEGVMLTNPPVSMGPVGGGAPSGWTGQTKAVSPVKMLHYDGHYSTKKSIIYVHAPELDAGERLAIRLRDEQGNYWLTTLETQGTPEGIHAFLVDAPAGTTRVVPELVILKSVKTEFTVNVPEAGNR